MKPAAWRLQRANYPLSWPITTRYRDQDLLAHINNVNIAEYFDDIRERLTRHLKAEIGDEPWNRLVTAEMRVTYLAEVLHPNIVDVTIGLMAIGRTSFEVGQALFVNGACASLCTAVLVLSPSGRSHPIPPRLRAALERLLIKHEDATG